MIFELISWIYISLICLIWGIQILKLFFGISDVTVIDFPIVCFIGMAAIGIISTYLSLVIPLFIWIKLTLQTPALLFLLKSANRNELFSQLKKPFVRFSFLDFTLLSVFILMILFLCTAPIIHPDTLSYHAFSTQIFDKYGSIPGIANLKPEYGFQSVWFAVLAFFDFSFFHSALLFPLNGCVMVWAAFFLVSKVAVDKTILSGLNRFPSVIWYLLLILFSILSWTQIRLTASSLSPDFIASISVMLGFYFFVGIQKNENAEKSGLMASFFSAIAVLVKLSAVPILLIPLIVIAYQIKKRRFLAVFRICFLVALLLTPVIIRNIISTGYPFYPSSFAAIYQTDWKLEELKVSGFQHYITAYARYPALMANTVKEYSNSFLNWLPVWWEHLYMIDKAVIFFIVLGIFLNLFFIKNWKRVYSQGKAVLNCCAFRICSMVYKST